MGGRAGLGTARRRAAPGTYHTDGLGSVRAVTDAAGAITNTYKTDRFGVSVDTQGPAPSPYRYTGEPRDAESGLVYLRARMYDPSTGRFYGAGDQAAAWPQLVHFTPGSARLRVSERYAGLNLEKQTTHRSDTCPIGW